MIARARFETALVWGLTALLLCIGAAQPAAAAELRVLCPTALRAPVLELARAFVRSSGHKVEFIFASVGTVHKRAASGERADVVIGTAQGIDALVRLGRGLPGSEATIARSVLALATRRGAPIPNIATAQALAQVLRDAGTLVQPDASLGVPGGVQTAELIERLELTAELKEKTRFVADAREISKRVVSGAAEIGIAAMSDLIGVPDLIASGPLIEPPTTGVSYAAVVDRRSAAADAGRALIEYLASVQAHAVFRAAGYAGS